jgi:hypothetical protein
MSTVAAELPRQTCFEAHLEDYSDLRSWGLTRRQTAERMGVTMRTVERYEKALRQARQHPTGVDR